MPSDPNSTHYPQHDAHAVVIDTHARHMISGLAHASAELGGRVHSLKSAVEDCVTMTRESRREGDTRLSTQERAIMQLQLTLENLVQTSANQGRELHALAERYTQDRLDAIGKQDSVLNEFRMEIKNLSAHLTPAVTPTPPAEEKDKLVIAAAALQRVPMMAWLVVLALILVLGSQGILQLAHMVKTQAAQDVSHPVPR